MPFEAFREGSQGTLWAFCPEGEPHCQPVLRPCPYSQLGDPDFFLARQSEGRNHHHLGGGYKKSLFLSAAPLCRNRRLGAVAHWGQSPSECNGCPSPRFGLLWTFFGP